MADFKLSADQRAGVDAVKEELSNRRRQEAVLVGPAGSGKSTTVNTFLGEWEAGMWRDLRLKKEPEFVCPTWRAALRLTEVTGRKATSIHKLIYGAPEEKYNTETGRTDLEFNNITYSEGGPTLKIVDECSMVGTKLYTDLMKHNRKNGGKILFVGDKEQLEPVNDSWGVDMDNPTALLTKVHRQQDGSNLLDFVTCVREGRMHEFNGYGTDVLSHQRPPERVIADWWKSRHDLSEKVVITFTNRLREGQNRVARRALGFQGPHPLPGEPLLSFANRAGLVNGEIVTVQECKRDHKSVLAQTVANMGLTLLEAQVAPNMRAGAKLIYVIPEAMALTGRKKNDFWRELVYTLVRNSGGELFNQYGRLMERYQGQSSDRNKQLAHDYSLLADVSFGYACTAHKAQGSQWDHVFVLMEPVLRRVDGGPAFVRRWTYTAGTRAARTLNLGMM